MKCKRNAEGYITLFAAIVLASVIALTSVLQRSAEARVLQLAAATAATRQAEISLSLYDRTLYNSYGLHGTSLESINNDVLIKMLPQLDEEDLLVDPLDSVWVEANLDRGIRSFMQSHLAISYFASLSARLSGFAEPLSNRQTENSMVSLSSLEDPGPGDAINMLTDEFYKHRGLFSEAENYSSDEEEHGHTLAELALAGRQTDELNEFLQGNPDLNPETMDSLGEAVSELSDLLLLLQAPSEGVYGFLALREYPLGMFRNQVSFSDEVAELATGRGYNLRGVALSESEGEERLETEEVITGPADADMIKAAINWRITYIRLLFNLLGIVTNKARMQQFKNRATIISVVVTVVSLGNLSIPVSAIQAALVLAEAWRFSKNDQKALVKGGQIALLPYMKKSEIFQTIYEDYLRIFLLTVNKNDLLERTGKIVRDNLGNSNYVSGVKVSVSLEQQLGTGLITREERFLAYEGIS